MATIIDVKDCMAQGGFGRGNFNGTFVKVDKDTEEKITQALGYSVEAISVDGTGENLFHVVVPLLSKGDQNGYPIETAQLIVALVTKIQEFVNDAPKI